MEIILKSSVIFSVLSIITYIFLRDRIPSEKAELILHWSISSYIWIYIIHKILPTDSKNIVWLGILWPVIVGIGESISTITAHGLRDNRGSVQMDMGALLNIGFSLSTVSILAKENGNTSDARCVALLTSSVIMLCLCFLMPSPALFRTILLQKTAVAYATGMLIITASINISLKLDTLCSPK
jgi:hypothetical protein